MKRSLIVSVLLIILAAPAAADFKDDLAACKQGDFATALAEWRPLAESGHTRAQRRLGFLYARGEGVKRSYKQAANWFAKAAKQGHAQS